MIVKPIDPEILDRLPPQNLDAEKQVIGAMLLDPRICDQVADVVRAVDFYADANKRLYGHVLAMHEARQPIDVTLLVARLRQSGDFELVGGAAYLMEVAGCVPYAANAVHYARIVREKAKARALIAAGVELLRDGYDEATDPDELLIRAETALAAIGANADNATPLVDASQAAMAAMDRIETVHQRQAAAGLLTGLEVFDLNFGGMFDGELIILAARPGVGKTALACQIADHVAARGRLVYIASLEMAAVELATRTICSLGNVSNRRIRTGTTTNSDLAALAQAANLYAQRKVKLDTRMSLAVSDIARTTRRLLRDGLALVVVDYLQLLKPDNPKDNRNEQVGKMARALKQLSSELNVPLLCLSQLNRESGKTPLKGNRPRPRLDQLRDSGETEQHAPVVWMLDREQNQSNTVWQIEKNRNGETGDIRLVWDAARTRFDCEYVAAPPSAAGSYGDFDGFGV